MINTGDTAVRSARTPGSPRVIAFVLQGGGSLSAPQVGALRALAEAAIQPDLLVGTSAGALNAVVYASDPSARGLGRLESLWLTLRRRHVATTSPRLIARALRGRSDGLFDAAPLRRLLLERDLVVHRLEHARIPAHVVASDLATGEPVVMSDGDSTSALLASAAFPGIYAPVSRNGRRLVDGGVVADVPLLQAESLGATTCYVLPAAISADGDRPLRGPLAMAYRALGQLLDSTARRDSVAARGEVHLLPAASSAASNPLDFRATQRLIEDGYRLAGRWLAAHPVGSNLGSQVTFA
jgi:NTE family protein